MCMIWYSRLFTLKNVRTNIYFELTHTLNNTSVTICLSYSLNLQYNPKATW